MVGAKREARRLLCLTLLLAGCGSSEASTGITTAVLDATTAAPFLAQISARSAPSAALHMDHAVRVAAKVSKSVVLIASTPKRVFFSIFDELPRPELESTESAALWQMNWSTSLERYGTFSKHPRAPGVADLDGDGSPELLFVVQSDMADRTINAAWICTKTKNAWTVVPPPSLLAAVRSELASLGKSGSIFSEDRFLWLETSTQKLTINAVSMGGQWQLVPRPDGRGSNLLAVAVVSEGEALIARHRTAFQMFCFDGHAFTPETAWNEGQLFITADRVNLENVASLPLVAQGFSGRLVSPDSPR